MKSAIALVAFVVAGGALTFWSAGVFRPKSDSLPGADSDPTPRPPRVVSAIGYVEPVSDIRHLTFKIDGVIDSCPVHVGQTIDAAGILATLHNHDEQAAVAVAEEELALARADKDKLLSGVHPAEIEAANHKVARLKEHLLHCQRTYERESRLFEQKVSTTEKLELATTEFHCAQDELDEAEAELLHLETFVRDEDRILAEGRVRLAEAKLDLANERFNNTVLTAPISGTVLEILKREGEAVRLYDPTPVLIFADLSQMRVRAEIDERYVNELRTGQRATIYGRGLGDQRIGGRVILVKALMGDKTVFSRDSAERKDLEVLQVFIEPDNPLDLPVGLKVDVELHIESQTTNAVQDPANP